MQNVNGKNEISDGIDNFCVSSISDAGNFEESSSQIIRDIVEEILLAKPRLNLLAEAQTLAEYYNPVLKWKADPDIFPFAEFYKEILGQKVSSLYGASMAHKALQSLDCSFYVNTGPHLSLPRGFDRNNESENNLNTLIFQGQIIQSFLDTSINRPVSLVLATSRVSPQNINSATYLQLGDSDKKCRLVGQKKESISQLFLPPIDGERLKILNKEMEKFSSYATKKQKERARGVIKIFKNAASTFSDQISTANSYIYADVLSGSQLALPITIETEDVELTFFKSLIRREESLIHKILSTKDIYTKFLQEFSDIQTGWPSGGSGFVEIENGKITNRSSAREMSVSVIDSKLDEGKIYPTNVLLYFALIAEAGLLCIGGMNQVEYGTTIRNKAASFLLDIGEFDRANRVAQMPTDRAIITPGIFITGNKESTFNLSSYSDELCNRIDISKITPEQVMSIRGVDSLKLSALALYPFVTGKDLPIEYSRALSKQITSMTVIRLWPNGNRKKIETGKFFNI